MSIPQEWQNVILSLSLSYAQTYPPQT